MVKTYTHLINEETKRLTNWPMLLSEGKQSSHPKMCHICMWIVLTWRHSRLSRLQNSFSLFVFNFF